MALEQIIVQLNPDVAPSGTDLAVVNAARRSFGKRTEVFEKKDENLIHYLARGMRTNDWVDFQLKIADHIEEEYCDWGSLREDLWKWRNLPTHDTPFNHCHISFEVKAPIFVARQLVKTEYAPFSEFSRRYITDDVEFYIHEYRIVAEDVKQGSGGKHPRWNFGVGTGLMEEIIDHNEDCLALYNKLIKDGVAPEQARGVLPVDLMTSWTWSATLGAFAKMCRERLGSDAQKETRYVAEQVYGHLKTYFPVSAKALVEGC